jgi:hypothetical protein
MGPGIYIVGRHRSGCGSVIKVVVAVGVAAGESWNSGSGGNGMDGGLVSVLLNPRLDMAFVGDHSLIAGKNSGTVLLFPRWLIFRFGATRFRTVRRWVGLARDRLILSSNALGDSGVGEVVAIEYASM